MKMQKGVVREKDIGLSLIIEKMIKNELSLKIQYKSLISRNTIE